MKLEKIIFLSFLFLLFSAKTTLGQETAPLKTFDFEVSVNKLKTQGQVDEIVNALNVLKGVQNCEMILREYKLTFSCTNHDMEKYKVMDRLKVILLESGVEIVKVKRTEQ
ncbi:MAG: hypothetical protein WDZ35_03425 [Crocinitomicaceae bacterium]